MDIEEFYAQNEARRDSAEHEFGDEWTDQHGGRFELDWVEVTGELYVMAEPDAEVSLDGFGDIIGYSEPLAGLQVRVVSVVKSHDQLETILDGWTDAMTKPNSITWLASRLPPPTS